MLLSENNDIQGGNSDLISYDSMSASVLLLT